MGQEHGDHINIFFESVNDTHFDDYCKSLNPFTYMPNVKTVRE